MKHALLAVLLAVSLLTGCGRATGLPAAPETGDPETWITGGQPSTVYDPPPTLEIPTVAPASTPTPIATPTPAPCDPEATDYCIVPGHFLLQRPIARPGNDSVDRSYRYGYTQNGAREPHHGVEFPNPSGTPVLAAAAGTVVVAGNDATTLLGPFPGFYGIAVVIEHALPGIPKPVYSLYGHLAQAYVVPGQTVARGDPIGAVGLTGVAVGSHLHFEVRFATNEYGSTRNPELWLAPPTGFAAGALALRVVDAAGEWIPVSPVVQRDPVPGEPPARAQTLEPYAAGLPGSDPAWGENFALGELPAGRYRLVFIQMGRLYERWVEVEAGKVTVVTFRVR